MSKEIKIIRETLHNEVWAEPMTSLAMKYGLSDVGLRKICKKMRIPLPPQGYHLREIREEKPPLPACSEVPQEYLVHVPMTKPNKMQPNDSIPEVAFEKQLANRIRVPPKLISPHKLVVLISESMRKQKPDDYGRIHFRWEASQYLQRGYLIRKPSAVSIFPSSLNRVLRLLDALFKSLERRHFKICQPRDTNDIQIEIVEELISIQIFEQAKRKVHRPTPDEEKQREWWPIRNYDFVPAGDLDVRTPRLYSEVLFREGKKRRLEDNLNELIIRLVKRALQEKENRLQREKEFEERRREEEKRRALFEAIQQEKRRVHHLEIEVENWHKAEKIRAYIQAVKDKTTETPDHAISPAQWIVWAQQQADRLDPLVESPPSILDEEPLVR